MKIINSVIQVACSLDLVFKHYFSQPLHPRANFLTAEQRNATKIKFCTEMNVVFSYVNFTVGKFVQVMFGLSSSHFLSRDAFSCGSKQFSALSKT